MQSVEARGIYYGFLLTRTVVGVCVYVCLCARVRVCARARMCVEERPLLSTCFHASFLLGLIFSPEDGGNMFLRNIG
jgi:hypothetical protein